MSSVNVSLYTTKQTQGKGLCAANSRLLMRWAGLSMRTFRTLVIVGGAEHAQTFNFKTAADSDDDFEFPFLPRE